MLLITLHKCIEYSEYVGQYIYLKADSTQVGESTVHMSELCIF